MYKRILHAVKLKAKKAWIFIRFGEITTRVVAYEGDRIPSEIEYLDRNKKVVGYSAFNHFMPGYPYQG